MFGRNIRKVLVLLQIALRQDNESTKEMLKIYYSFTQGNVNEKELEKANNQLNILLKEIGFGVLTILPFSPITIPLVARLARKYKIDIVPDWFKDSLKK